MSKLKCKKLKNNNNNQNCKYNAHTTNNSNAFLISVISNLVEKTVRLIVYLKNLLVVLVTMMLASGGGSNKELSSKKEARLRNKQSKLAAEYRLVTGKEEDAGGDGGGGGKRRKVDEQQEQGGGDNGRKVLNEEEFKKMKLELAERKRMLMNLPRFKITQSSGLQASVFLTEYTTRAPLLLSDIQHLVTYAYGGNDLVPPPSRWCHFQKPTRILQVVLLFVEGVGLNEFVDNEERFSRMMGVFGGVEEENRGIFEILDPKWYGDSVFGEVERWGVLGGSCNGASKQLEGKQPEEEGKKEAADKKEGEEVEEVSVEVMCQNFEPVLNQLRSVFPIGKSKKSSKKAAELPSSDKFPRTALVLSLPQLIHENYPLPIPANTLTRSTKTGYTQTSESYSPVTPNSKMYSIDCEMCEAVGDPNALIRIGVVDEELSTVYESLVKPEGKIMDYRTRWSGVSEGMMEGVETTLEEVQRKLMEIVEGAPGCIFVGQSLNCDLKAMKILHPYVIDTSTIFNLTGIAGRKSSLKDLSLNLLDEIIQNKDPSKKSNNNEQQQGHDPVEDAMAAMKLVKAKLANGYSFGNSVKSTAEQKADASDTSTLVAFDDPLVKNKLLSSGNNNKLSKDVLIVTQHEDSNTFPFSSNPQVTLTTSSDAPISKPNATKTTIKTKSTNTNGNAIKLMHTNFLESFLTAGFYKLNRDSDDFGKTLGKLDKRVEKLFNRMCSNSMLVVVGCGGSEAGGGVDRKNNGVCFVRVKVDEIKKKRRD